MKHFFYFCLLYLAAAFAILFMVREDPMSSLVASLFGVIADSQFLWNKWPYVLLCGVIGWVLTRRSGFQHRIMPILFAFFGCLVFSAAFSLVKTTIPHIVPFYADPMLANLDAALHLGNEPWVLAHKLAPYIPVRGIEILYFDLWLAPALFFPVILAVTDTDTQRTNRYLMLYTFCWIGLGNVVAMMFSSVGPVYFDRLLDAERFAGLTLALENAGLSRSFLGGVQEYLWLQYVENGQSFGSGISAFPSVHVGVATVVAFYLAERSRFLMPVGVVFLAAITFASVYNGWHYAVDGYVSIMLITAAWAVLQRRNVAFASYKPA
jgi:hypothetical protein